MLEASITKYIVMQDEATKGTVLMGVAEYGADRVNFKVPYNWETLDYKWFVNEIREVLAREFDVPAYHVDIRERQLLEKMKQHAEWLKKQDSVIIQ